MDPQLITVSYLLEKLGVKVYSSDCMEATGGRRRVCVYVCICVCFGMGVGGESDSPVVFREIGSLIFSRYGNMYLFNIS